MFGNMLNLIKELRMELAGARFELAAQRSQLAIEKKVSTHLKAKLKVCTLIGVFTIWLSNYLRSATNPFCFIVRPYWSTFFM
jgi:hypothetical protein